MIVDAQRHRGGAQAAPVGPPERLRSIGPFAMVAHILPVQLAPGELPVDMDVRGHPHIGLAAVTYVLDGAITHRDNLGIRREIVPGAVGYTVAGRGVVHSERFERLRLLGGHFEMFQILLALPDGLEDIEPSFAYHEVPESVVGPGVVVRALHPALAFPAPLLLEDVRIEPGASHVVPDVGRERAVYVLAGDVEVGGERAHAQQTVLLGPGPATVTASSAARVLAFGGEPVGPRYQWWN
ncbi:MAG: pirin family protein [Myxococcales bacterium]|nr:pirin family protein [Myxococcales bacterium]